jgi:hypothetical protein
MITILRRRVRNIWVSTLKVKVTAWPCSKKRVRPITCYWKSDLTTISQRWSPYWIDVPHATFGSLPWRSRSCHDLAAKSCPAHYFIIWSRILQLFHKNDHNIETMCCAQYLGCFYTLNFVCCKNLTQQEVYLPVSKTWSGSITRFNRLLLNTKIDAMKYMGLKYAMLQPLLYLRINNFTNINQSSQFYIQFHYKLV